MTDSLKRLIAIRDDIEFSVRLSRGWWRRIVKDTGCRLNTLVRLASDAGYDPQLSELAKIDAWFQVHGVQRKGPQKRVRKLVLSDAELAEKAGLTDAFAPQSREIPSYLKASPDLTRG